MKKEIFFKNNPLNSILPVLWLIVMIMWLFNYIRIGQDFLRLVNIILSFVCSLLWGYRFFWLKKTPYLVINENYITINFSILIKKIIMLEDIYQIDIQENKLILIMNDLKRYRIIFKLMNKEDEKYLTEYIKKIYSVQKKIK